MAYDAKDPADKKIVDALIKAAVDASIEEMTEAHEADVTGLKKKNDELVARLKKAREGQSDPDAVAKLETDLEKAQAELKEAGKLLKTVTKDRDTFKTTAETETAAVKKLFVEQGLTDALMGNNVGKQFLSAAKALLGSRVEIKADGDTRSAVVDGKPLGEFVKTWAASDEGKVFVTAPANGGGGAPGGSANGSGKTVTNSAFQAMDQQARMAFSKGGGQVVN